MFEKFDFLKRTKTVINGSTHFNELNVQNILQAQSSSKYDRLDK